MRQSDSTSRTSRVSAKFPLLDDYPRIKDSIAFMSSLKDLYHLETEERASRPDAITYFRKHRLMGYSGYVYLIEYSYDGSANAGYPWKYLLVFKDDGTLLKKFDLTWRFRFLTVPPHKYPFLYTLESTPHGNGGNVCYGFDQDSLRAFIEDSTLPQTFTESNDPDELPVRVLDENHDGYCDLVYSGHRVMTQDEVMMTRHVVRLPISYILLYSPSMRKFVPIRNYELENQRTLAVVAKRYGVKRTISK